MGIYDSINRKWANLRGVAGITGWPTGDLAGCMEVYEEVWGPGAWKPRKHFGMRKVHHYAERTRDSKWRATRKNQDVPMYPPV